MNWLVEMDFKAKFKRIKEYKLTFPFVAVEVFFLLYVIGLTFSTNLEFGKTDVLLKLPLLLFPLVIFTANSAIWKPKMAQNLLYTFALGNLFAALVSLANSFLHYNESASIYHFLYGEASRFFHPSYASLYYCFSFVIILYLLINKQLCLWKRLLAYFMFLLFPAEIVLLNSRTGLLAFIFVMFAFTVHIFIFNRKKILRFMIYMSVLACILVNTFFLLPEGANRLTTSIHNLFNKSEFESASTEEDMSKKTNKTADFGKVDVVRTQVWSVVCEVIKEHPVFGVGTGDIKDALMEKYIKYDLSEPQQKGLNAHNQYLQVAGTLGFVGLAVFISFLVSLFWLSWRKRNILLFFFGLIGVINFWTESMLEKQIGVMFFAFFFALLGYIAANHLLIETQNDENKKNFPPVK